MKFLFINGPNLNLVGTREPEIYGKTSLEQINGNLAKLAGHYQIETDFYQSNHEGLIIDALQNARSQVDCIILNPGAFTHYSYAIRDCIAAIEIPVIEVHLSNIYSREEFRHQSVITPVAAGQIAGLGMGSYLAAFYAALYLMGIEVES